MRILVYILFGILSVSIHGQEVVATDNWNVSPSSPNASLPALYSRMPSVIKAVDSIVNSGIRQSAFPGAQILVAWKGDIIFHKSYGFHTYDSIQAVGTNDLYDLASLTKILGPLPALMKLYDEGKLDLDEPFSTYWKSWQKSGDKRQLTLREILAHQAGLKPYIVFLDDVSKGDQLNRRFVRNEYSPRFQNQAFENLYVRNSYSSKIYKAIKRSEVSSERKYRYSGLAYLIFPELISQLSGHSYEYYLQKNFYLPLGAAGLVFKPKTRKVINPIVPTELDTFYRKALVQGWVHDENASLLGGISGNAGLFGTARDLYIMMQLYQNYGQMDGIRVLKEQTVREFTSIQFPDNDNRRGLGFDKPLINNQNMELSEAYPAPEASPKSFGHSGFTGTFAWADPEYQLVYIFLSNRVYPNRSHRKLYELNIRTAIQQVFYRAVAQP